LVLPAVAWAATGFAPALLPRPAAAEAVLLDVGHGLSVLVRSAGSGTLLYDAGGRAPGIGDRVVVPALRAMDVAEIDMLCVSHEDIDHCGAVEDVLREIRVGRVVVPSGFGASPAALAVLDACAAAGVPVEAALTGDVFAAGGLRADVLHPEAPAPEGAENEDSLVLRVAADDGAGGALTVLLTGDLDGDALDRLVERPVLPSADLLVLPHHGRGDSAPQEILARRVGARHLVASGADGAAVTVQDAWVTGSSGAIRVGAGGDAEAWPWRGEPP
jgi:competence protein ComEC